MHITMDVCWQHMEKVVSTASTIHLYIRSIFVQHVLAQEFMILYSLVAGTKTIWTVQEQSKS